MPSQLSLIWHVSYHIYLQLYTGFNLLFPSTIFLGDLFVLVPTDKALSFLSFEWHFIIWMYHSLIKYSLKQHQVHMAEFYLNLEAYRSLCLQELEVNRT